MGDTKYKELSTNEVIKEIGQKRDKILYRFNACRENGINEFSVRVMLENNVNLTKKITDCEEEAIKIKKKLSDCEEETYKLRKEVRDLAKYKEELNQLKKEHKKVIDRTESLSLIVTELVKTLV